ncbi:hypothetical protein BDZ89DRAFT_1148429 [Hymenopellis radicata]|nr:hypothetical protein BDZ89DRAFT_1148429 [Hymenopellis radicata]
MARFTFSPAVRNVSIALVVESTGEAASLSPSPPAYYASLPPTASKALHTLDFTVPQSSSSSITISIPGRPDDSDILPTFNDIRQGTRRDDTPKPLRLDLLKFMYEIAKGMQYLRSKGVLHGDLKASNALVDDEFRCVITDFDQSETKSEVVRLSGTPPPHGALRCQAPEIMMGLSGLSGNRYP